MKKIFFILTFVLLNIFNSVPAYAYDLGLLYGKTAVVNGGSVNGLSKATDNNSSSCLSFTSAGANVTYNINLTNLTGYYVKGDSSIEIDFYENSGMRAAIYANPNGYFYNTDSFIKNINKIVVTSRSSSPANLYDLEIYNTPPIPYTPNGLSFSGSGNSGTLTWSGVTSATSYNIYDGGTFVSSTPNTYYSFINLDVGSHIFYVSAVNSSGESAKSSGATYIATPHAPVINITDTTASSAKVNWESVPGAISYDISINGTFLENTTATTYNLSGLLYKSSYTVSIVAKSNVGDSPPGSVTFITADLPSPPEGLQVTNITSSTLDLSWIAVPGAITYILDQNDIVLATTTDSLYHCSGLTPNTTYTYKVAVTTAIGESNYSDPVVATTQGIPPTAPMGLSADNINQTSFSLYWLKQSDTTSYNVYLDGTLAGNVSQPLLYNPSFDFTNLTDGSTHIMTVIAVNQWGESTASQPLAVTLLPSAPTGLQASNISTNSLDLSWITISGATSYVIFQNNNQIATTTDTTYHITNLNPDTAYSFQIAATNGAGEGPRSNTVNATTLGIPPLTPNGLSAGKITNTSFSLYWLRQSDATNYNVYMDGTLVGNVSQTLFYNPSFELSNLTEGSTHSMTVTAVNQWGVSAVSQPLIVTAMIPNPVLKAIVDNSNIKMTWTGLGNDFNILVNNEQVNQVTSSPYTLIEKPGTYQIQVIQNYNGGQYPSNILPVTISALQNVGAAKMTEDILSSVGVVIAPVGGLLAIALALKGGPMLIVAAKALMSKT